MIDTTIVTRCPFCCSISKHVREFQRSGAESLSVWACPKCACEFLSPQPSDAWLSREYSGYFEMRKGNIPTPKSRLCKFILSKVSPISDDAQVLDIGGGEGHLVCEVLQTMAGTHVTLVEPQADEKLFPRERVTVHRRFVEDWLRSTPPMLYDVIFGMDLIEHLRSPLEVIGEVVKTRLKQGGILVLTTPDAGSWYRAILGPLWPHYKVEHLTYPSKGALGALATYAELEVKECSSLAKPLPIGYIIAVLKNFGPLPVRRMGRIIDRLCPNFIRGYHVSIPSGELLFVAKKRG